MLSLNKIYEYMFLHVDILIIKINIELLLL